jgi:hypothetical protein
MIGRDTEKQQTREGEIEDQLGRTITEAIIHQANAP